MGLDIYLNRGDFDANCIELESTIHPHGLFKIGYFRSSYNQSGINHVLGNMGLNDLYDVFNVTTAFLDEHKYNIPVDWEKALGSAKLLLIAFDEATKDTRSRLAVMDVTIHQDTDIGVFKDSIVDAIKKRDGHFDTYSSKDGFVSLNGFNIVGACIGKNIIDAPCIHLVYEKTDECLKSYRDSIDVIIETIEYVLKSDTPSEHRLYWSG